MRGRIHIAPENSFKLRVLRLPVPLKEFETRLESTRKGMENEGLAALIVYSDNRITGNVRYLSNFSLRYAGYQSVSASEWIIYGNSIVVVPAKGNPTLITDCDFAASAVNEMSVIKNAEFSMDLAGSVTKVLGDIKGKIGVTTWDKFPHPLYESLKQRLPHAELKPTFIIENLRMIKSEAEVAIMKRAAGTIDEAMGAAVKSLQEGKTEKEICLAAEYVMDTHNPSPLNVYQTQVVTFGKRTAFWSYPSQAKLRKGDLAVIDLNNEYDGYVSDITRTKVFGRKSSEAERKAYSICLEMFEKAVEAVRPGAKAFAMWEAAEKVAKEAGYQQYFRPLISHGLGLDIQEKPSVGVEETILQPNMLLTCEPALCMKNYGLGVEDTILVTESGHELITKYEKEME